MYYSWTHAPTSCALNINILAANSCWQLQFEFNIFFRLFEHNKHISVCLYLYFSLSLSLSHTHTHTLLNFKFKHIQATLFLALFLSPSVFLKHTNTLSTYHFVSYRITSAKQTGTHIHKFSFCVVLSLLGNQRTWTCRLNINF